ncbi:MAG: VWA domain-containing protein [Lentisphaeria bacterium]|jgi:hypothetical protein|nr:VWA domain-containing protein [Lentisphaeria bacterium]MDP7741216.1 VWA domain-containing protein [Lentisphaeria bacterium]
MNDRSPTFTYLTTSILISLVLHLLLWQATARIQVRPIENAATGNEPDERRVRVESLDIPDLLIQQPAQQQNVKIRLFKKQKHQLQKLFESEGLITRPKPRLSARLTGLGVDLLKDEARVESRYRGPITSPPPEILAIRAADLPAQSLLTGRRIIPDVKRYVLDDPVAPSLVSLHSGGGVDSESVELGMRFELPTRPLHPFPPPEPGDLPMVAIDDTRDSVTDRTEVNIIDSMLDVEVSVYKDPKLGGGYFKAVINTRAGSESLESIPRDVLFLVDASASITPPKLREFRKGLALALDYLSADDRFNVVAFRDKPIRLFPDFKVADEDAVVAARKFLSRLRSKGKTNVYAGLAPFINFPRPDSRRPYLIFLLSDGRSTTGSALADNEFITQIIQHNRARACVFSFSAGEESNLFLMDLLSYKNRGLSLHADSVTGADEALSNYISGKSEVLVSDLHCQITGKLLEDIYPRELPHLFRDDPLTVYGRFPKGADEIGIQIIGYDINGEREELIVRQLLSEAGPADSTLARQWAGQKIYYLVGERTIRNSPEIQAEIDALASRYGLAVPY